MNHAELIEELTRRKALIVHCSRIGKGDEGVDGLFFPDDMNKAIDLCDTQKKELCCSVIWPDHVETFGDVGIILKPRSTEAITLISTQDGGTSIDEITGKRYGDGVPFSRKAVEDTFENSTGYNEWNINDADTVGFFVKNRHSAPEVAALMKYSQVPGFTPEMGDFIFVGSKCIEISEIEALFPRLSILTIEDGEIVDLKGSIVSPYEKTR